MGIRKDNHRLNRPRAVLLAGLLALVTAPSLLWADGLPGFTGYTRPGAPDDRVEEGKVIPVSTDAQARKTAVGATVYFMVLERKSGDRNNPWDASVKDLMTRFHRGVDSRGTSSPSLDTSAKYLYLYQVVNDRGTDRDIRSASVKLLAGASSTTEDGRPREPDERPFPETVPGPKAITSWGSFSGTGFALPKAAGPARGEVLPVSAGFRDVPDSGAVYRSPAPPVSSGRGYQLREVPTRRQAVQTDKGIARIGKEALDPAAVPDYVILLGGSGNQRAAFRAIWNNNSLKKGMRSTVFGFTSNLPPTMEPVQIEGSAAGGAVRPADTDLPPGSEERVVAARGEVPSPLPASAPPLAEPPVPPVQRGPPPPSPAPQTPPGLLALPVPVPTATAPTGMSPAAGGTGTGGALGGGSGGGSGSGGGFGGGSGGFIPVSPQSLTTLQQLLQQQQQQQGTTGILPQISLNVQLALTQNTQVAQNQGQGQTQGQGQRQSQGQKQSQGQTQGQTGGTPGDIIPEPPAVVLGLLGLPFLLWLMRRYCPNGSTTLR
jgi:hypothetical protein